MIELHSPEGFLILAPWAHILGLAVWNIVLTKRLKATTEDLAALSKATRGLAEVQAETNKLQSIL